MPMSSGRMFTIKTCIRRWGLKFKSQTLIGDLVYNFFYFIKIITLNYFLIFENFRKLVLNKLFLNN